MTRYFEEFPVMKYDGKIVRDITRKVQLKGIYTTNADAYLPYTVENNDKPEDIAHYYYGSVDYTWLVCLCNNVIDPYNDWVLSGQNFENMLMKKYQKESGRVGYEIVTWCMNTTITANVRYYFKDDLFYSNDTIIAKFRTNTSVAHTVGVMNAARAAGYKPMRVYDEEYETNERKRSIILLNKNLLSAASEEFKRLMKQ
jgi:hypothetical protein